MLTMLADFWHTPIDTKSPDTFEPKPGPVFIGDIISPRAGTTEFLVRWREDKDRLDQE